MPTGYTAKLIEDGQTFPEFALTCARAFGALIEMRDEPLDAPIPDKLGSNDESYHAKVLRSAERRLQILQDMPELDRITFVLGNRARSLREAREALEQRRKDNKRIMDMMENVSNWEPPTEDHQELKTFMLQQLEVSLGSEDYYTECIARLENDTREPLDEFLDDIECAKESVEYHRAQIERDRGRGDNRNEWLRQLRESLAAYGGGVK